MGNCFAWFHRLLLRDKQLFPNPYLIILSRKRQPSSFFSKTPFLISFKKFEKGDEMSCLDRRMTFPVHQQPHDGKVKAGRNEWPTRLGV